MASDGPLPPALLKLGVPVAGILLVVLFIGIGFPYGALGDRIAYELKRSHGIRLEYQEVGLGWILPWPAVAFSGVRATLQSGEVLRVEEARLRPALSTSWLGGDPALAFAIRAGEGEASGTVYVGDAGGLVAQTARLDLAALPLGGYGPFSAVKGTFDASVDLRASDEGPRGDVSFEGADGSLDLVGFPVAIPFDALSGRLVFGDGSAFSIERLALAGPVLNGTATGSARPAARLADAPLQIELSIEAKDAVVSTIRSSGVRVGRDGKVVARITGTLSDPVVR